MLIDEPDRRFKVLELYCGIGGLAAALEGVADVVAAIDINEVALDVYRHNFDHPALTALVDGVPSPRLAALGADLWWASPPCQPFTRRGLQRDLDDPRTATWRALIRHLEAVRPRYFALENVVGFESSSTRQLLLEVLERSGYANRVEVHLCPTELGLPNARPRYYLLASRDAQARLGRQPVKARPLADFLDGAPSADLLVEEGLAKRYAHAMHVVEAGDRDAVARCFTAAYGRSPVRSGSYLATEAGPRHFSPNEVLRLLGFPSSFRWPESLARSSAWRLAGNSLSLPAVRHVLAGVPELQSQWAKRSELD